MVFKLISSMLRETVSAMQQIVQRLGQICPDMVMVGHSASTKAHVGCLRLLQCGQGIASQCRYRLWRRPSDVSLPGNPCQPPGGRCGCSRRRGRHGAGTGREPLASPRAQQDDLFRGNFRRSLVAGCGNRLASRRSRDSSTLRDHRLRIWTRTASLGNLFPTGTSTRHSASAARRSCNFPAAARTAARTAGSGPSGSDGGTVT